MIRKKYGKSIWLYLSNWQHQWWFLDLFHFQFLQMGIPTMLLKAVVKDGRSMLTSSAAIYMISGTLVFWFTIRTMFSLKIAIYGTAFAMLPMQGVRTHWTGPEATFPAAAATSLCMETEYLRTI
jgi:hypothetical protein